ncbi:ATP phosphoribosyltransferase regulatory subunit [Pseudoflavonifractor capillosus]|uniref:ATP phosphoribosyltransferase regulatory subunit n=1 Tax=Pseudoflavonifractor capillosus TaxID=106588 RepID=UPI00195C0A38|nr:ATP phosphoribosyltransferase regulatory subunit [Pseudoflavonifractor capillosus]MBM6896328.1 ATP phosphoribosyltransferase regulatory subunit [Pseudoflavonifractor capillosus]
MNIHFNTPEGTRDRLYAECLERRQVQGALVDLFRRRGYAEVITPEVEFYDLFVHSGSPLPQETMLKIIDRSGKIMVMRPDTTTPIARLAATKLKTLPLPQRLYYDQTVFRSGNAHEGGSSEIAQCGVEMLGATGKKADLEMITLAVDALRACGLTGFHIEVGHVGFYQDLASRMNMPQQEQERMRLLIEGKNYAVLNDFLEPYSTQPDCTALRRLPYLFGGAEVLQEARALAGDCPSLDYLELLYGELCQAGYGDYVQFDLGLVHQIDYYTGVVFRGYAKGAGAPVLSGGRYDNLVELFGRRAEATGFAVDVDAVGGCLEVEVPQLRTVIHYESGYLGRALEVMDRLPAGTCELSPCRTLASTMNLAKEKGALQVLSLDDSGERWLEV